MQKIVERRPQPLAEPKGLQTYKLSQKEIGKIDITELNDELTPKVLRRSSLLRLVRLKE